MNHRFRMITGAVDADTHVVELQGELDLATLPHVRAALDAALETGKRFVVLDLDDVVFVDSTTLGVMLAAHRRLEARGGRLVTVCSDPLVARVFEITRLTQRLSVMPSRREALTLAQHLRPAA
jgi:anti-sigma B factor antagonist